MTVTGGTAGTDLSLDKTSLSFTASNWNVAQTVTVSAGDDADGADDTATLMPPRAAATGADPRTYFIPGAPAIRRDAPGPGDGDPRRHRGNRSLARQDEPELHRLQLERGADGDRKRGRRRGRRGRRRDPDPVASGGGYGTVSKDLPVTVKDDDALALVLSAASLEVPEEGSVGYTVKRTCGANCLT